MSVFDTAAAGAREGAWTTEDDTPLIEAHGLMKRYRGFTLQGIDLAVHEGEVVGFVGQNGAGKTTTIKALLGLIDVDGGEARVLGTRSSDLGRSSRAARVKEEIGVVLDTVSMPPHLRIADVGRVYTRAFASWDAGAFERQLATLELDPAKRVKELSRGMGMKLSLACALSHHARLLILDEATAGLDPLARDEALDVLRDFVMQPGRAVLLSSHITSDLERVADRVVCIDAGRIIFDMPKDAITDEMGLARCRAADVERIAASGMIPAGSLRYVQREMETDVLVPDRFAFAEQFPAIPCDRMTIDEYLTIMLKGGVR